MLPIAGRGGIETTVDQTLMRGLNTAGPWFVSGLPLSHMARVAVSGSQNHNEGCPDRPPRPAISSVMELNFLLCIWRRFVRLPLWGEWGLLSQSPRQKQRVRARWRR